jgi:dUTP pyrophosphatase
MDNVTKRFKTATHVIFDEAFMTLPPTERSPAAMILQQLGYAHDELAEEKLSHDAPLSTKPLPASSETLQVKCLSVHATLPTRATDGSAGYDLYSAVDTVIAPHTRTCIPLDITIVPPIGTYGQIFSRSGMSAKHHIDVRADTIDRDYTGNIKVLLDNTADTPFTV